MASIPPTPPKVKKEPATPKASSAHFPTVLASAKKISGSIEDSRKVLKTDEKVGVCLWFQIWI